MVLYKDEKAFLDALRDKVAKNEKISPENLTELMDKFEDLLEMGSVSMRIIDRLMHNYDKLKKENNRNEEMVSGNS
jgi:hypothetical protein